MDATSKSSGGVIVRPPDRAYSQGSYNKEAPHHETAVEHALAAELGRLSAKLDEAAAQLTPREGAPAPHDSSNATSWNIGILGVCISLALSYLGVIGTPVGPESTHVGALLPLGCVALAALGLPGSLVRLTRGTVAMLGRMAAAAADTSQPPRRR